MKKILAIILVASAFFTISASAQRGGKPIEKQALIDSLKISDVTADSVIAIRDESMTQVKSIMSDESIAKEDKRAKAKPIMMEMKARLEKILTPEQMAKLQEMEMNMRQKQKNK